MTPEFILYVYGLIVLYVLWWALAILFYGDGNADLDASDGRDEPGSGDLEKGS